MIRTVALGMAFLMAGVQAAAAQRAADEYFDPQEMEKARRMMKQHHGGQTTFFIEGERLEYQSNNGEPLFLWDAQGWVGGDLHKFWVKTEGEYLFEEGGFEEAEVQGSTAMPSAPISTSRWASAMISPPVRRAPSA